MTMLKKRILFVDDEPAILAGLQNLLYKDRKRWDMVFALGGQLALDEIRKAPFDIVVSDMRMPGIDGAVLFNLIKDECPATVRIMLSGHADREAIVRALPALHQLLSKPCDATTLRGAIERSLDGTDPLRDAKIHRIIGGVDKLPTPPEIYYDLSRLMESPTASVADVVKIVTRDPGLAAKLLQLVNSAYFGTGQAITSIQQAVALLGTDRLRYIALTASVFSAAELAGDAGFSLEQLQRESMRAAWLARSFADAGTRRSPAPCCTTSAASSSRCAGATRSPSSRTGSRAASRSSTSSSRSMASPTPMSAPGCSRSGACRWRSSTSCSTTTIPAARRSRAGSWRASSTSPTRSCTAAATATSPSTTRRSRAPAPAT